MTDHKDVTIIPSDVFDEIDNRTTLLETDIENLAINITNLRLQIAEIRTLMYNQKSKYQEHKWGGRYERRKPGEL